MTSNGHEEKKEARDYTPIQVNFRELFTLITGTQAREIHKDMHRVFDGLTGYHVSCVDFPKAWYATHVQVARQVPEVTAWLKSEWGVKDDEEFTRDEKSDADLNGMIDRGREKFGDKFMLTPVDAPKGKDLLNLAMGFLTSFINDRIKDLEKSGESTYDSGDIDLGDGTSARLIGRTGNPADGVDELLGRQRSHLKGKKDHWPN